MQRGLVGSLCRACMLAALAATGVGCNLPAAYGLPARARQALISFFTDLSTAQYVQAADLYGGDYTQLEILGPDVDAPDRPGLWQNACEKSGMQCLPVATAKYLGSAGEIYTFMVEFRKPDGNLFAVAPCCGEPGFIDPPMDDFIYRVRRTPAGQFLVVDLPVYVP